LINALDYFIFFYWLIDYEYDAIKLSFHIDNNTNNKSA